MCSTTVFITAKEHMEENITRFVEMFSKEVGRGINTRVQSITETTDKDKYGNSILRVTVEIMYIDEVIDEDIS